MKRKTTSTTTTTTAPVDPYNVPMTAAEWTTVYNGYGTVNYDSSGVVMAPKAATVPSETHACLITAKRFEASPLKNFQASFNMTTEAQLRTPVPNAWEVGWFMWAYRIDPATGKKICNYICLKSNGVEIGTCHDSVGQVFIYTSALPKLTLGLDTNFSVKQVGTAVTFSINGSSSVTLNDARFYVGGTVAFYNEDSRTRTRKISVQPLA